MSALARVLCVIVLFGLCVAVRAAEYADQGAAYAACMDRDADAMCRSLSPNYTGAASFTCVHSQPGPLWGRYRYRYSCNYRAGGAANEVTNSTEFLYPIAKTCAARPALTSGWGTIGVSGSCQGGCVYGAGPGSQQMTVNGTIYFSRAGAQANGSVCDGKPEDGQEVGEDQCSTINNLTQCVTSNGKHCAVASSGKRFCWNPNETGTKVSGNEAATKSPEGVAVNNPPVPPKNNGDWQTTGQGGMSSSQGGNTTNYNVTNHTSNYGSNGSGGGAEGEGSGGGDGEGDGDGPGTVGEGVGDLYTPTDKTISSVFGEFRARVGESPIVDSVSSFFSVNVGGSCPVFTVAASEYWETMSWSAHCEGDFNALLTAAGWVLLALASFLAAYIALT